MITQEFLSQCSDEQINKGVVWLSIKEWGADCKHKRKSIDYYCSQGLLNSVKAGNVNYCNNPSDIMPIAFANEISIEKEEGEEEWCAMSGVRYADGYYYPAQSCDTFSTNKNPLRAICEVYILMSVNK